MFGPRSDWYRNLSETPAVEVEVRGEIFQPAQRVLPAEAAQRALDDYRRRNPIWSRLAQVLIGRPFTAASMPVIAFRNPRRPEAARSR
jgi:deazaflavin-dependent oxidoreductase (nitroreductase family)